MTTEYYPITYSSNMTKEYYPDLENPDQKNDDNKTIVFVSFNQEGYNAKITTLEHQPGTADNLRSYTKHDYFVTLTPSLDDLILRDQSQQLIALVQRHKGPESSEIIKWAQILGKQASATIERAQEKDPLLTSLCFHTTVGVTVGMMLIAGPIVLLGPHIGAGSGSDEAFFVPIGLSFTLNMSFFICCYVPWLKSRAARWSGLEEHPQDARRNANLVFRLDPADEQTNTPIVGPAELV